MTKNSVFFCFVFLFWGFFAQAQIENSTPKPKRPSYFQIGTGINDIITRDFGVSPLFYAGLGANTEIAKIRRDTAVESRFSIGSAFGLLDARLNQVIFVGFDASYGRLYQIRRLSNENWNTKIGGTVLNTTNIRVGLNFGNNAFGFENITNLAFSAKVTRDVSRKKEKTLNLLLFKKVLQPKKRELSYTFHSGLVNMNFRPGYSYKYLPKVENNNDLINNAFADYHFSAFNGYRFKAQLDYTRYLFNGNASQISYIFDVYQVTGKSEPFQYATHAIQIAILFRNK